MCGINVIAEMYGGVLRGAALDSCNIAYKPKHFTPGRYMVDINSAGKDLRGCCYKK